MLGRPRALAFGAAVFSIGTVLQAGAVDIAMFAIGRFIEGLDTAFISAFRLCMSPLQILDTRGRAAAIIDRLTAG